MADSNIPRLVLCYLHRAGAHPFVKDGKLLIGNPEALTQYDRDEVRLHKAEIIALIERGGVVDDFRWHPKADTPAHRARALPRPLPMPAESPPEVDLPLEVGPEPPGGWEFTCRRCGAHQYHDHAVHDGRSTRRDCATCRLTDGFPTWNPSPIHP